MVDAYRINFFENIIKEEKEKERQLKILQKNCFHNYIANRTYQTYEERICSICAHSAIKNIHVWNGTKNGSCIIA